MSDIELNYVPRKEHDRVVAELHAELEAERAKPKADEAAIDYELLKDDYRQVLIDLDEARAEAKHLRAQFGIVIATVPSADVGAPRTTEPTGSEGAES